MSIAGLLNSFRSLSLNRWFCSSVPKFRQLRPEDLIARKSEEVSKAIFRQLICFRYEVNGFSVFHYVGSRNLAKHTSVIYNEDPYSKHSRVLHVFPRRVETVPDFAALFKAVKESQGSVNLYLNVFWFDPLDLYTLKKMGLEEKDRLTLFIPEKIRQAIEK